MPESHVVLGYGRHAGLQRLFAVLCKSLRSTNLLGALPQINVMLSPRTHAEIKLALATCCGVSIFTTVNYLVRRFYLRGPWRGAATFLPQGRSCTLLDLLCTIAHVRAGGHYALSPPRSGLGPVLLHLALRGLPRVRVRCGGPRGNGPGSMFPLCLVSGPRRQLPHPTACGLPR